MPNRFNNIYDNQYVSTHVPLPFNSLVALASAKQKQHDDAISEQDSYIGKTWNRLGADAENARNIKAKTDSDLAEFSGKNHDDPTVQASWYNKKKELADQFGPDGEVGAMEANYKAFQDKQKELKGLLAKGSKDGGITQDQYDYILKKGLDDYTAKGGIGQKTAEGYNQINFETPATYQDIYKQAQDATKDWKANAVAKGGYYDTNGQFLKKSEQEIESIDGNEIMKYVTPALMNDPMNRAFAKQQAEMAVYGKDHLIGKDEGGNEVEYSPDYVKDKVYNDIFQKPVQAVAAEHDYTKTKSDQQFTQNDWWLDQAKDKKKDGAVPVYTTPATDIKGNDYGNYFDLQKKGSYTPFTHEEAEGIYKKYGTTSGGFGKAAEYASAEIALGKQRTTNEHDDIQSLPKPAKEFALSSLKVIDKALYDKVNNGEKLTEAEKSRVYPQIKTINDIAKQDIVQSSTVVGLTAKESETTNLDLFGNKADGSNTVDNLGTGNAGNVKFYDKETGNILSVKELKDLYDGKEKVSVRGKLTADNPYSFVTNDDQFADAKQLFIGGKEYISSGPKQYVDPTTGSSNVPENQQLQRTKVANDIYKAKFTVVPQEKTIYNQKVIVGFKPFDMSDRSKGEFIVNIGDDHETFESAQEAEDFILKEAIKKQSKK